MSENKKKYHTILDILNGLMVSRHFMRSLRPLNFKKIKLEMN